MSELLQFIVDKHNLRRERLTVHINNSTTGAYWVGIYLSPECVDGMKVVIDGKSKIVGEFKGMEYEIFICVPENQNPGKHP
jgi:hypothetical protein